MKEDEIERYSELLENVSKWRYPEKLEEQRDPIKRGEYKEGNIKKLEAFANLADNTSRTGIDVKFKVVDIKRQDTNLRHGDYEGPRLVTELEISDFLFESIKTGDIFEDQLNEIFKIGGVVVLQRYQEGSTVGEEVACRNVYKVAELISQGWTGKEFINYKTVEAAKKFEERMNEEYNKIAIENGYEGIVD